MKRYYYDLHIHSCLSPCGDDESTPNSIAGMGKINGLDVMALTDHNTCKNCPAFFEAAERYGVLPIAGMELTTSEDIHIVCLFPTLERAMEFDGALQNKRILIPNRIDIFGRQNICDSEDKIIGQEEHFLPMATSISVSDAVNYVEGFGGICYPAHIDREANGIVSVLGTVPEEPNFPCFEIHNINNAQAYIDRYNLKNKGLIISSDAHYLHNISEADNFFFLEEIIDPKRAGEILIKYLRKDL